ncbi:muts domain V-domain-containing protein [Amylocystis lapponica]|nr:muts domain V-domain-containing protein [Amylocystis lapponica]
MPRDQATISSFFTQPTASHSSHTRSAGAVHDSPIDLTLDSDSEAPPPKRQRTTTQSTFFSHSSASPRNAEASLLRPLARNGGGTDRYRFDPTSRELESSQAATDEAETQRRREKAKNILLGKNAMFFRSAADLADASLNLASESEDDNEKEDASEISGEDSDKQFGAFLSMVHKSKTQKRRKGKQGSKNKKTEETGPSGKLYTRLELQVRDFKLQNPGTVLMFEVGYKIMFYGDDAKIASAELGIVCFPKRNFFIAMIPLHRREIHLKKLLSKGYKVGVVEQTETAALKKLSDSRNELFARKLTHLYTAATYVDELNSVDVDDLDPSSAPPLMCIVETPKGGMGTDERVCIGMIIISPSTGDVVWDEFEDNHMRTELETRMVHTKPYELLLPSKKLSKPSDKMISHFTEHSATDHKIRIERFKDNLQYTQAFSYLSNFYTDKTKAGMASDNYNSGKLMAAVADFPKLVVVALAHSVKYLSSFEVEDVLRETRFFAKFAERTHMLLNGNTLTNLEIYRNETDLTARGSLMWILDHTSTRFGARMLRSWVGRPLVDTHVLQCRIDAVEEIQSDTSPRLTVLRQLLRRLPDLARGLCRIQYGKCTPQELAVLLPAFDRVAAAFPPVARVADAGFRSELLNEVVAALPRLREPVRGLVDAVELRAAKEGKKERMWRDPDKYPEVDSLMMSIDVVESELEDELKNIRNVLKRPSLKYTTWNEEEYIVEVFKNENRVIPDNWQRISSTKKVERYRTPEVLKLLTQRAQYKEALAAQANKAYLAFLQDIAQNHYGLLRDAVNKLATADCLLSLALVAVQEGYVKPQFTNSDTLEIVQGRHPMVEALRSDPFVPNTVHMGAGQPGSKIITGPNMGGKSSAVRMMALCAIMAQIGSYVPAQSMKIGMLDGILTRMGASDELARGRSTFMVEMQETSDILQLATPKTLVILDELGRGTSTFDGMAIAGAVLQHLTQVTKCKTLFITHYPQVATDLERRFGADVENLHMGFTEDTRIDGTREVTFLYQLTSGITEESFGVECARLAGVPEAILQLASTRSQNMRATIEARVKRNK